MQIELFDFELPDHLIAQEPSIQRDLSRLMVLHRNTTKSPIHSQFQQIGSFLQPDDLLILNNTRVFPARLQAQKLSGGKVELLLVEPISDGVSLLQKLTDAGLTGVIPSRFATFLENYDKNVTTFPRQDEREQTSSTNSTMPPCEVWRVLTKASRPLQIGSTLALPDQKQAWVLRRVEGGEYLIALDPSLQRPQLFDFLEKFGQVPLPPYIAPDHSTIDHKQRYQTVFAKHAGAIAAPTAGLHFTPDLLSQLQQQGIRLAELTLHVGLGTFLPVRVDNILKHQMHAEIYDIPEETVLLWKQTKEAGGRVIAVGTTALRALEAASQESNQPVAGQNRTSIFIYPGYSCRAVDGLITNFHLPRSTLFMLVSAFYGREQMIQAYQEAIAQQYRFYSYGDAMLIL